LKLFQEWGREEIKESDRGELNYDIFEELL
jgi:hypothetical protein